MSIKILILAPHTDDGEIGCGGTIARYSEEGAEVYYAAFSTARQSLRSGLPLDTLEKEVKEAICILGIPANNLLLFDYDVRYFPNHRQEILQDMIDLRNRINPDMVFAPSMNDIHQDHQVIAREALRAFKNTTILGYEEPWNNVIFETRTFVILQERHIKTKIEALHCYRSQQHRDYLNGEYVRSQACMRGVQIQQEYAEAFELMRLIL